MDNKELHEEFLKDFKELLKKYDAEFYTEFQVNGWFTNDVPMIQFNYNNDRGSIEDLILPKYIAND